MMRRKPGWTPAFASKVLTIGWGSQTLRRRKARDMDEGPADSGHDSADNREPG
jgi:hypothetical protein